MLGGADCEPYRKMLTTSLVHTQPISENNPQDLIPCALRISVAQRSTRVPTHFVILLDTSDSMNEDQKLENVKQCIHLLMNVLGQNDFLSLVTFASDSRILLNRVPADSIHRSMIEQTVSQIRTDGMTNLSAGLSSVFTVMRGETLKSGLLLLTDGHANTGTFLADDLRTSMDALLETYPLMSLSCVAYGTNHNAELLQSFSRNSNGPYCIVNSLEDTAVAVGDTLGGLMSCAAQGVELLWPRGTEVQGMYTTTTGENYEIQRFGDLYCGSDKILLAKVPAAELSAGFPIRLRGMEVPAFQPFTHYVGSSRFLGERDPDIYMTRLQNQCATLFRSIRQWNTLSSEERATLEEEIEFFATSLNDELIRGLPVHGMLVEELTSMRNALAAVRFSRGGPDQELASMLSQHETYVGLGRGATTSIQAPQGQYRLRRQVALGLSNSGTGAGGWNSDELNRAQDPEEHDTEPPQTPPRTPLPQRSITMTTPYQTQEQRRVTEMLRSMSNRQE
jgi:Mg-chelatase subunit ChlD